ncbi:MAG: nuclear transport factor 2 family protein [Chloroflexi bacterium]|nr:nuclear transport factor 2 family protein [Chloroflexota bacterium]
MTDARAAAREWAATWQRCWEALDATPIVALYADGATFSSHPFRDTYRGRAGVSEYVEAAFADESEVRAWFGEPIVDGDRAAVSWWAALREAGEEVTLAGTSVLRFDADGLVADQWDAWNMVAGHREPPGGWGG